MLSLNIFCTHYVIAVNKPWPFPWLSHKLQAQKCLVWNNRQERRTCIHSFTRFVLESTWKMSNLFFCHLAKLIICLSTRRYILFSYWHKVLFAQIYILLNVCTYLFLSERFCKWHVSFCAGSNLIQIPSEKTLHNHHDYTQVLSITHLFQSVFDTTRWQYYTWGTGCS